ncbi:type II toxin-antitoxin system RatA family toxin [Nitrosomonas sp. Nm132]|jgi:ribosome-associated toxin RatA of RatAB toxin-antitoxin module|uniref:type II toxin-antitoxin system RatA family toxin n=1 Tax=Nitrosomonas sp. Nm132 TaxID=1881053 RepID=UPI00088C021B|nr:type II toxin-antitoxin system RatA family toxin [Nitrosomonas sp. Nm132]SDH90767.1 Ribosome association toxin PasT (RatA) of the RatAB toxin-antitoxin module [Nitrosomonas sp. Nm132]
MAEIEKSVLVGYSAGQMFRLVDTVENYPEFLPWCDGASVKLQSDEIAHATVHINYHHIKHSFTTENKRYPPELIEMNLLDGPFERLNGHWRFIPLSENACKIEFRLHYTFSHKLLEKLIGPVFYIIANSFVEAFVERAEAIYGTHD